MIAQCLSGLKNAINKSDNILFHGKTEEEHDECLEALLERMEECGLTARIDKCEFAKERIVFFGYDLSADGIRPTEEKEALRSVKKPTTVRELQCFLGLAGWVLRRFVPGYSTLTEPLSALTKKGVRWNWAEPQEKSYMAVMALLDEQLDLYHFDPVIETKVYSDASPVGLGAMLCQIDKSGKERTINVCQPYIV